MNKILLQEYITDLNNKKESDSIAKSRNLFITINQNKGNKCFLVPFKDIDLI